MYIQTVYNLSYEYGLFELQDYMHYRAYISDPFSEDYISLAIL